MYRSISLYETNTSSVRNIYLVYSTVESFEGGWMETHTQTERPKECDNDPCLLYQRTYHTLPHIPNMVHYYDAIPIDMCVNVECSDRGGLSSVRKVGCEWWESNISECPTRPLPTLDIYIIYIYPHTRTSVPPQNISIPLGCLNIILSLID